MSRATTSTFVALLALSQLTRASHYTTTYQLVSWGLLVDGGVRRACVVRALLRVGSRLAGSSWLRISLSPHRTADPQIATNTY